MYLLTELNSLSYSEHVNYSVMSQQFEITSQNVCKHDTRIYLEPFLRPGFVLVVCAGALFFQ